MEFLFFMAKKKIFLDFMFGVKQFERKEGDRVSDKNLKAHFRDAEPCKYFIKLFFIQTLLHWLHYAAMSQYE